MKKIVAIAVVLGLAGSVHAASVGFEFGTNFYKPSNSTYNAENGTNFTVYWLLDNDVKLGVYNETSNLTVGGPINIAAIQVAKGVVKNVFVGLNLGSATVAAPGAALVDIFGQVALLSGGGEKVSGSLVATVAARYSKEILAGAITADGYNMGLGVNLGF